MQVYPHFLTAAQHPNGREKSPFWYTHLFRTHYLPISCEKHLKVLLDRLIPVTTLVDPKVKVSQ